MINDINKRVLNWRFTLVLIKINYGQIGDQTGLFYTTNPVFYTSGNRFVRRTGTFGNLIFSLVPSDNHNTRSTCPTSVFTGTGQRLMSRPDVSSCICSGKRSGNSYCWSLDLKTKEGMLSSGYGQVVFRLWASWLPVMGYLTIGYVQVHFRLWESSHPVMQNTQCPIQKQQNSGVAFHTTKMKFKKSILVYPNY